MMTRIKWLNLTIAMLLCTCERHFTDISLIEIHCASSNGNSEAGLNNIVLA